MKYFDIITTPSKKSCKIPEIKNKQYKDLLKFAHSDSYQPFFEYLDSLVKKYIPDFDAFNIVDKCYIYLAACFLNIKSSIMISSKLIEYEEIPLIRVMDNIEEAYSEFFYTYKVNDNLSLKVGLPVKPSFEEHITLDYASGIYSAIKNDTEYILTAEERDSLVKKLPVAVLADLEIDCIKKMKLDCELYRGVDGSALAINLVSPALYYSVFQIYKDNMDNFYTNMYSAIHYLKMTYADFNDITPNELTILFHIMVKDAEEQKKKMEEETKGGGDGSRTIGRHKSFGDSGGFEKALGL